MDVHYTKSAEQLFQEIEANGFAKIDDAINPQDLSQLQTYISQLTEKNDGSFAIVGHDNLSDSALGELYQDENFLSIKIFWAFKLS